MNAQAYALETFSFESNAVRTYERNGEIWFVATDIAKLLDYPTANHMTRLLDEDEQRLQLLPTSSGAQNMLIISESGLFSSILKSRKPEAKHFRKWVTSELLPTIRRTGSYNTENGSAQKLSVTDTVRLLQLQSDLIKKIGLTTHQALITTLYQQIIRVSRLLDEDPPELDDLLPKATAIDESLYGFWHGITALLASGQLHNHARDPRQLALNLPEAKKALTKAGQAHLIPNGLNLLLRISENPKLLSKKTITVRSAATGIHIRCWIFEWPPA